MKPTVGLTTISGNSTLGEIVISNLSQFEFRSETVRPSVKMVLSGAEHYKVNGRSYALGSERFLVVDKHSDIGLIIDDPAGVSGVCIFPSADLINEVASTRIGDPDILMRDQCSLDDIRLMEQFCNYRQNQTGSFLRRHMDRILGNFQHGEAMELDDFYLGLAECMVHDQLELDNKLGNLASAKRTTREELYRRVSIAKDFIEDNFTEKLNLDDLVGNACLSKYHFLRSFKAIYHQSPYQYLLNLRLEKAKELLQKEYSMSEINDIVGFSDVKNLRRALNKAS